ncbi:MAG: DUF2530 domain-containing protein [Frankia sp.]|nr:DUF2530 domain-containing protein [Frankia sp.]
MNANAGASQRHGERPGQDHAGQALGHRPARTPAAGDAAAPAGAGPADGKPAGLAPLPNDGVGSVAVGTVVWLIALLVMIPFADDLRADGRLWWLATAACGAGLGLLGLVIVIRRRNRLRRAAQAGGEPRH